MIKRSSGITTADSGKSLPYSNFGMCIYVSEKRLAVMTSYGDSGMYNYQYVMEQPTLERPSSVILGERHARMHAS